MDTSANDEMMGLDPGPYWRNELRDMHNTQMPLTDEQWAYVKRWQSFGILSFVMVFSLFFPPFILIYGIWWFVNKNKKRASVNAHSPNSPAGFGNNGSCFVKPPR
jgi:hypothetical protein